MLSHVGLAWCPGAPKDAPAGDAPARFRKEMRGSTTPRPGQRQSTVLVVSHRTPPSRGLLQTPRLPQCQVWRGMGGLGQAAQSSGLRTSCHVSGDSGEGRPSAEWSPQDSGVNRDTGPPSARALGMRLRTAPSEPGPSGAGRLPAFLGFQAAVTSHTAMLPPPGPTGEQQLVPSCAGRWPR